jgi:hypothetical protein
LNGFDKPVETANEKAAFWAAFPFACALHQSMARFEEAAAAFCAHSSWASADIIWRVAMSHSFPVGHGFRWPASGTFSGLTGRGVIVMVTILLKPLANGGWSICRHHITLFSDLQLGAAIKLAREMARDEFQRLGREIRVEMPGPISTLVLASYTHGAATLAQGATGQGRGVLAA